MRRAGDPPSLIFVGTRRGNAFMNELLDAVAFEVGALGFRAEMAYDGFPDAPEAVFVVIPHEFFPTVPRVRHPTRAQLRRTISFCVEQPGTPWFETSVEAARTTAAAVDINPLGVKEMRRRGVAAAHFQVGYTPKWDLWRGRRAERPLDVVHLGTEAPRRLDALALYGADLWRYETRLLLPGVARKTRGRSDYLEGADKWAVLAQAKIVLNIHRQPLAYFEWVRVVEAICNGCVVVSESSPDAGPLVAGEHYVAGRLPSLGMLADGLLSEEAALETIRDAAHAFLRESLPMAASAERLAELAIGVARAPRSSAASTARRLETRAARIARAGARRLRHGLAAADAPPQWSPVEHQLLADLRTIRTAQKRLALSQIQLARALQRIERNGADPGPREVARSAAYDDARPRVTVVVPLYNHHDEVVGALRSVARSTYGALELLILDDGSTDDSQRVAAAFVAAHPELPAALLAHDGNRGLGATRNALVRAARGELVLPLDADNDLYPSAIGKLVAALDAEPESFFAYPILEVHSAGKPIGLLGYQPWDRERLRVANYIDALSLIRRDVLLGLGGYTEDIRLHGWEDYDLWCRAAAEGLRATHVPQILARYAKSEHSMLATTNLDDSEALAVLRQRYPSVFSGRTRRPSRA